MLFDSYPQGGSDLLSNKPNMTRSLFDLRGSSDTHEFDESMKYIYQSWGVFDSYKGFFDHTAVAFFRVDTKQTQNVKSCQLQVGLVNRLEYEGVRSVLSKHNREYQTASNLPSLSTNNWTWHPINYNKLESGTWRRNISQDTLTFVQSNMTASQALRFMKATTYGKYSVNVERVLRT